jgi:outer membrane protein assembly factor BamB
LLASSGAFAAGPESGLYLPVWGVKLTDPQGLLYLPEERAVPAVSPDYQVAYCGSSSGKMRAYDFYTGIELWFYDTGGAVIASEPLVEGSVVFFGTSQGTMIALNRFSGRLLWKYQATAIINAKPAFENGRLFFQTRQNQVVALDASTGKWLWHYQREAPESFTVVETDGPVVRNATIYAGFTDGSAAALNANDGSVIWQKKLAKGSQFTDITGSPAFFGDRICFPSYTAGISCLDPATGRVLWTAQVQGGNTPLATSDGNLLVTTGRGEITLLDGEGRTIYGYRLSGAVFSGPRGSGFGGYAAFTNAYGSVYVVDTSTLKIAQTVRPGKGVSAVPLTTPRSLMILTNTGWLYKFSHKD